MSRAAEVIAALPPELRAAAVRRMVTLEPDQLCRADLAQLTVGTPVFVLAFGAWRGGVVVKVTRTRAAVLYTTPSSHGRLYLASTSHPRVGAHHPAAVTS